MIKEDGLVIHFNNPKGRQMLFVSVNSRDYVYM